MPGMRERCVKIGSAGKIFSLTGWKVGFVCAAPNLLRVLAKAHQFITFTTPPNLQAAVAYGLGKDRRVLRRDARATCSAAATASPSGLRATRLPGDRRGRSYFVNIDLASLGLNEDDEAFCKRLVLEHKVAAIPVSAFYADNPVQDRGALLLRQARRHARRRAGAAREAR